MISSTLLLAAAVIGLLLCVGLLIASFRSSEAARVDDRLQSLGRGDDSGVAKRGIASKNEQTPADQSVIPETLRRSVHILIPSNKSERARHQARLFHAGIYHPSALRRFFAVKFLLMTLPALTCMTLAWQGLLPIRPALTIALSVGAFGAILPSLWLDHRIKIRHKQLRRSLPDFLDLMIVCLDGGLSLQGAIQRVSDEFQLAHPMLAREMQTVQRDVDLGATVEAALKNLAERTGLDNLKTLSTFVRESLRFGTELAEALRQHAEMLRTQREQSAEEQAQKASVQILLPTLILILPAVFVVVAGPAAIQIQQAFAKRAAK